MVCAGMFLFSSCTDFLKQEPRSALTSETFFSSLAHAESAVNGLYRDGIQSGNFINPDHYNGNHYMFGGYCTGFFDNLLWKGSSTPEMTFAQRLESSFLVRSMMINILFESPYRAINRANVVINVLPDVDLIASGISQSDFERIMAEARFFRARNYLYLVRHFGDVPMITKPQAFGSDDLNVTRSPMKTIYDEVIIPDLQEAVRVLAVRNQYGNKMRITAPIASAHLIDACVQMAGYPLNDASKWALAAAESKKFLPGGAYESHFSLETNEDFAELSAYNKFRSVNVHVASPGGRKLARSDEFVYAYEFASGIDNARFSANAWPYYLGSLGSDECKVIITNNVYQPMPRYLAMYDPANDLRMKERQFFANSFDLNSGEMLLFTADITPTPYFYHDYGAVKVVNSSGRHFALYRLAEMYLFAAEAIAQTEGVTAQAVDALAVIRARAYEYGGISKDKIAAELSALSKDEFIEQVWLERYRELVFEWKEWNMIQRTRKYPKTYTMDASIPLGTVKFVDITTVGTGFSEPKLFTVNNLLWPIPWTQMRLNPNLTQNPGYE